MIQSSIITWILVYLLGGVGTSISYLIASIFVARYSNILYSVILVNLLGSYIAGVFYGLANYNEVNTVLATAITAGFTSGFTTVDSFAVGIVQNFQSDTWKSAILYLFAFPPCAVLAAYLGWLSVYFITKTLEHSKTYNAHIGRKH